MKQNVFFWSDWDIRDQVLFAIGAISFFAALGAILYFFDLGYANLISWERSGTVENVDTTLGGFTKNFLDFTFQAKSYLITERFTPSGLTVNFLGYKASLVILLIGISLAWSAVPSLPRLWYGGTALAMALWIGTMGLNLLDVLSQIDSQAFLGITLLALIGPSYIFHAVTPDTPFGIRWATFAAIMGGLCWLAQAQTTLAHPEIHFLAYASAGPVVAMLLFAAMNGHEILRGALYVLTNNSTGGNKNAFGHFILVSLIYFGNLIYTYLHFTQGIDWDLDYIHPFYVLALTACLGLWGIYHRRGQLADVLPHTTDSILLYLGVGLIAFSGVILGTSTVNDPLIEVMEDIVLYTHIGFGLGFMLYIYLNFQQEFRHGLAIYRILYNPQKMDFLLTWALGSFLTIGFFLYHDFFVIRQYLAGYNNAIAESLYVEGEDFQSAQFYNIALSYDQTNHRSNYTLGAQAFKEHKPVAASYFFTEAVIKRQSPYPYAIIANLQASRGEYFQAISTLKKGIEKCENNSELYNNLALLFNQASLPDSVYKALEAADQSSAFPEVIKANAFSFLVKHSEKPLTIDNPEEYVNLTANYLAYINKLGETYSGKLNTTFLPDSFLTTPQLNYLYNFSLNNLSELDTATLQKLKHYASIDANSDFKPYLDFCTANALIRKCEAQEGFKYLHECVNHSSKVDPTFPRYAGLMCYYFGNYVRAEKHFKEALRRGDLECMIFLALAQMELKKWDKATDTWKEAVALNPNNKQFIEGMLGICTDTTSAEGYDESFIYHKLYYGKADPSEFKKLTEEKYKTAFLFEKLQSAYLLNDTLQFNAWSSQIRQLSGRQAIIGQLMADDLAGNHNDTYTASLNKAEFYLNDRGLGEFLAARYWQNSGNLVEAVTKYKAAIKANPFREKFYITLADLYNNTDKTEDSYSLLLEAINSLGETENLLKAYISTCLRMGYSQYIDYSLESLKDLLDKESYEKYEQEVLSEAEKVEQSIVW